MAAFRHPRSPRHAHASSLEHELEHAHELALASRAGPKICRIIGHTLRTGDFGASGGLPCGPEGLYYSPASVPSAPIGKGGGIGRISLARWRTSLRWLPALRLRILIVSAALAWGCSADQPVLTLVFEHVPTDATNIEVVLHGDLGSQAAT